MNRSQEDIISHRNIGEARAAELEFFNAHAEYSSVAAHCGLHNLAKALNHILVEHIRALLPSLKTSIEEMLDKRFHELKLYGDPMSGQSAGSRYNICKERHKRSTYLPWSYFFCMFASSVPSSYPVTAEQSFHEA